MFDCVWGLTGQLCSSADYIPVRRRLLSMPVLGSAFTFHLK